MKRMLLSAVALAFAVATPAFAETQSIKVGGDFTATYLKNSAMTLSDKEKVSGNSFFSQTRVYFEADLTDNVKTYVRFLNQREWDGADNIGSNVSEDDIDIDLAYVQLSEFLYSPLTLTIGRQEIVWGSGLVIADGIPNVNINSGLDNAWYGLESGFDAIRAQLDLDLVMLDFFIARIDESFEAATGAGSMSDEADTTLYGINVDYIFPSEVMASGYWVFQHAEDRITQEGSTSNLQDDGIHTIGARIEGPVVSIDESLHMEAELAYQFGNEIVAFNQGEDIFRVHEDRKAWAAIIGGSYVFHNEYEPKVSLYYDYRSGDGDLGDGKNKAWSATHYVRGIGNLIDQLANRTDAVIDDNLRGGSGNIHGVTASVSFVPFEDIEAGVSLVYAHFDEKIHDGPGKNLGVELIGSVTYDYTEDVMFSFQGSFLNSGNGFTDAHSDDAYELVSSVTVEF